MRDRHFLVNSTPVQTPQLRENHQKCPKKAKMLIQGHVYPIFEEIEHFKCQKQILHRIWERIGGVHEKFPLFCSFLNFLTSDAPSLFSLILGD